MNAAETSGKRAPLLLGLWAETSNLALIVSEWVWLAALYTVLFGLEQDVMPVFVSFALPGFLGYVLSKFLHYLMISKPWLRIILALWVAAALALWLWGFAFTWEQIDLANLMSGGILGLIGTSAMQSLLLQIILVLLMIRRSVTLPASVVNSWQVVRSSQIGLLMFLVFGLTTTWDRFAANLVPFALYLFIILVALTSARLAELSNEFGGKTPAFSRSWLISIGLLALAFVIVSSLSGWLMGVVFVDAASSILNFLYYAVIVALLVVLSPLLIILIAAIPFLNQLVANLVRNSIGKQQAEFILSILQPKPEGAQSVLKFMDSGLTIILAITTIIVIAAVIFGVRLRRHRRGAGGEEEIGDLAAVQKMLKDGQKKRSLFESALGQARRWLASARIRRIYALLMKSCAGLNQPRPPSFTPIEFQPQLDLLFPELTQETRLITNTYLKVRYGEYPELLEDMQDVHTAWESIKKTAEGAIRERKRRMRQE